MHPLNIHRNYFSLDLGGPDRHVCSKRDTLCTETPGIRVETLSERRTIEKET